MLTYNEAKDLFSRARSKHMGKRLEGRSTWLVETPNGYGIKYHNTIVVEILRSGEYILNSGRYRTSTTKERINTYSPIRVFQRQYVWYTDTNTEFTDGMKVKA